MPKKKNDPAGLRRPGKIDRLIHEPARLSIVAHLSVVECADFLFLLRQTGLTKGNLSSHLSRLEEAGYVAVEKQFVEKVPRTLLRLTGRGREAFRSYRRQMKRVLDGPSG
jgi:DNA-binding transcriptional ArsR family regulator